MRTIAEAAAFFLLLYISTTDQLLDSVLFVTVLPSAYFSIILPVSLFKHTHLSLQQSLTAEFAFLLRCDFQDTQITQRHIYGICIIHEVKITDYLDERQLDNYS